MTYPEVLDLVLRGASTRYVALLAQRQDVSVGECIGRFWDETLEDASLPGEPPASLKTLQTARSQFEDQMVLEAERELNQTAAAANAAVEEALREVPDRMEAASRMLDTPFEELAFLDMAADSLYIWQVYSALRDAAKKVRCGRMSASPYPMTGRPRLGLPF